MKILELYQDFSIEHLTEGHKHCRPGWVQVECPFCEGNPGYHLGFHMQSGKYTCWRCGGKSPVYALAGILKIKYTKARELIKAYGGISRISLPDKKSRINLKDFHFPSGICALSQRHLSYLSKRGFDAKKLVKKWELRATGPVSHLDKADYKHRIVAPVFWGGEVVSFQARDVTNKSDTKYKACSLERETVHHKDIVYGRPEYWGATGVCVEGITDVWRFGFESFATFGIKFTTKQIRVIAKNFERVAVVFDPEKQAQKQAKLLVGELRARGVEAWNEVISSDPGDMPQKQANKFMKRIMNK